VNVKKADRPRYWVTLLFRDLGLGATFSPQELHLTVVPWFVTELPEAEVIKSFKFHYAGQKPFEITVGELKDFRSGRRISVNLVKPVRRLKALHDMTLDWMKDLDGRWAVKSPYVATDYVPHIRRRRGRNFNEHDKIQLNNISFIKAFRRGDDLRTVIAKVDFNEK
jgi:2'-5' RNA ligase